MLVPRRPPRPVSALHPGHNARLLIVTATLGRSRHLAEALESIHRLRLPVEHVVVAPGAAHAAIRRICPNCRIVPDEDRGGIYAGIRRGVEASEGWSWFTYLNDDDLLKPGFETLAHEHITKNDPRVIAYGDVRWIDAHGENLGMMPVERDPQRLAWTMKRAIAPFTQQGTLTSAEVYRQLGGFDLRYSLAADFDFWVRALRDGFQFEYYGLEVACWRIHADQASMQRDKARAEARAVADTLDIDGSPASLSWHRLQFMLANAGRYLERFRATGALRSEGVFRKASGAHGRETSVGEPSEGGKQ